MIELLLNLFWLVVAVWSVFYYRRRLGSVSFRRLACRSAIALGCTLAILFPVISLTDDLHAEQAVVEDSKASRKALKAGAAGDRSPNTAKSHHAPPVLLSPPLHFNAGLFAGLAASQVLSFNPRFYCNPAPGRAPPLN